MGRNPTSVAVADVNRDGKPDLVVGTITADAAKIGVLLGNGNGTFLTPTTLIDTYSWPASLSVADFDGDGKLDLVIVHWAGDSPVGVMPGNGIAFLCDLSGCSPRSSRLRVFARGPQPSNRPDHPTPS